MKNVFLVCSLALAAAPLLAQDAGVPESCNPETFVSTCSGSTLTYCSAEEENANTLQSIDCQVVDPTLACGDVACTGSDCDQVGSYCVGNSANATCFGLVTGTEFGLLCGPGFSCVAGVDLAAGRVTETCRPRLGGECTAGEQSKGCVGDILTACLGNEPGTITLSDAWGLDCAAFGATCSDAATDNPECVSGEQGICGGNLFACAPGLTCVGETPQQLGTCTADTGGTGGTGGTGSTGGTGGTGDTGGTVGTGGTDTSNEPGSSRDDPEEAPASSGGFGCQAVGGNASILGLALLALALIRRRRA